MGGWYKFTPRPLYREVELAIPHFSLHNCPHVIRVSLMSGTDPRMVSIAQAGKGSFRLAYDSLAQFPLRGFGPAKLRALIKSKDRMKEMRKSKFMLDITVHAINRARVYLMGLDKQEER